ncbi:glycosyltransferase family 2 protein [Frigidibacter sp.]|uniref:glycosyltransferase family 2 protein n=1 Tax=Frigidibacter sp. TaxID=2586418 RepID=UPI002734564C|nr:hypothetical protein [Frigidibacter sp.]MDP3338736.1 hypothetical protein [Frigidibacter sp.]
MKSTTAMRPSLQRTVTQIATSLERWSSGSVSIPSREWVALSGLDRSNDIKDLDDLFWICAPDHISLSRCAKTDPMSFDIIDSGTLRNSFYPELFMRHSNLVRTGIIFRVIGRWTVQVSFAAQGCAVAQITEVTLAPPAGHGTGIPYEVTVEVPLTKGLPDGARLFWRARADEDQARLLEANWSARAPFRTEGRLLVVLRTFGRTQDIVDMLESFQEEADRTDAPRYRHLLCNTFFLILDTSVGVSAESYKQLSELRDIRYHVFSGANLGGGGNMSQVMRMMVQACESAGVKPDDLLLLDDDLSISIETLYRHWASTLFRSDDTVFTVPVFMKSEPRKMWEDGAFWGRFLGAAPQGLRTHLAPRLLRHNLTFREAEHLDTMAVRNYPEYCTFIFFGLSWRLFEKLGYPLAIFLRGDDIEYSLRVRKMAGAHIMSNPNLAAWHEPAHSYGQEYMSIAHGMLINMAYGQETPDALLRFFHAQALRHLSLHDVAGLMLYREILRDFLSKSAFLENGFARHYVDRLKLFKLFDAEFESIPGEVIDSLRHAHSGGGAQLAEHPFLYMGVEPREDIGTVLLFNQHARTHRVYRYDDVAVMEAAAQMAAEIFSLIAEFGQDFSKLRAHYLAKIEACRSAAFWDVELSRHDSPATLGQSDMAA